ncbi:MAG: hypothetical protein JNM19_05710 [Chitinophagaceae bacterium]|nr:hypothetical protein [Chitinophagaceae bacterium]
MKKLFLLTGLLFTLTTMQAQTKWTVSCTGKAVLKNVTEDTEKNILKIKRSSLSKTGNISIAFDKKDTAAIRTIMADDTNRSGLKNWEDVTKPVTITNAELQELFTGRNRIELYYTEIPRDPAKAALVRVRPVHLCSVILQ